MNAAFFQALETFAASFSDPWKSGPDFFQALENGFGLSIGGRIV
jgi:hypothetical protein